MENVLALTGDPPSVGDYPFATGVYEVNARGLVEIISKLNNGVDYSGSRLASATGFWVGVAANPSSEDEVSEIRRLEEKLEAGGGFVMTQPVYDVERFSRFLKRAGLGDVPVIAGVLPLVSSRQAEFLHFEVPGIVIPESIRDSMSKAGEENARNVGVNIAATILKELSSVASGACIMTPLKRYDMTCEVMAKAGLTGDSSGPH